MDKQGANSYSPDGKRIFDASRGITIYNKKKLDASQQYSKELDDLENVLRKRYDSVKAEGGFNAETGKAQIKYTLERHGHKTVAEFYKEYGEYEMPIKFTELKD